MISFQVNDMTCGHCVGAITRALKAADPGASVSIDLTQHLVMVDAAQADPSALRDAIAEAGYSPVPVPVRPHAVAAQTPRAAGCCGHCG